MKANKRIKKYSCCFISNDLLKNPIEFSNNTNPAKFENLNYHHQK